MLSRKWSGSFTPRDALDYYLNVALGGMMFSPPLIARRQPCTLLFCFKPAVSMPRAQHFHLDLRHIWSEALTHWDPKYPHRLYRRDATFWKSDPRQVNWFRL
jgi:hypothetical protein